MVTHLHGLTNTFGRSPRCGGMKITNARGGKTIEEPLNPSKKKMGMDLMRVNC